MTWIAQAIGQFGASIGIDQLAPDDAGTVRLSVGDGTMGFEVLEEELLVYLARPLSPYDVDTRLRSLSLCRADQPWQWPVQAGTRGDALLFVVRLPARQVSFATIEQALDLLRRLHDLARG